MPWEKLRSAACVYTCVVDGEARSVLMHINSSNSPATTNSTIFSAFPAYCVSRLSPRCKTHTPGKGIASEGHGAYRLNTRTECLQKTRRLTLQHAKTIGNLKFTFTHAGTTQINQTSVSTLKQAKRAMRIEGEACCLAYQQTLYDNDL